MNNRWCKLRGKAKRVLLELSVSVTVVTSAGRAYLIASTSLVK